MAKIYSDKPTHLDFKLEVSTVFIECERRLLFLQRSPGETSPGRWAIPGGKLEKRETSIEGLMREIKEEIELSPPLKELEFIHSLYVDHPLGGYELHLFRWRLSSIPSIKINAKEHSDYRWQPLDRVQDLLLLEGQLEAFHSVYNASFRSMG